MDLKPIYLVLLAIALLASTLAQQVPPDYPKVPPSTATPTKSNTWASAIEPIPGTGIPRNEPVSKCYGTFSNSVPRVCTAITPACQVSNITQAESCLACNKGWGVFRTLRECLDAPYTDFSVADVSAVDPSTYPSPPTPTNTCPSEGRGTNWGTSGSDPCPHKWPDLKLWEHSSTWPNWQVPPPGSAVTLPERTRVLITPCSFTDATNTFRSITVPASSELILDDGPIHLRVGAVWVSGRLRAGSRACRTNAYMGMTFVVAPGVATSDIGIHVLPGGELDLHGAWFNPTWTRLSSTAMAGQNWLPLQDPVNWRAGQIIAIATSIFRDELTGNQNEVMTIQSVSQDRRTLVLTAPLLFTHYGGPEYQSEVALLSRTTIIQGGPQAEALLAGAQMRIGGQARLEGVLAYRVAQRNIKGTYPFHFHLLGDVLSSSSYVTDCAVYRSFYRAYVIHGTNNLLVKDNIAFHVDGNAFYIEDGVEENNWLEHNFAGYIHVIGKAAGGPEQTGTLHIQQPDLAQPADAAASGFYAANPNNVWINNAASGGWAGFSFPALPMPIGNFRWRKDFVPSRRPLGRFEGNTAHSSGYYWIMAGSIYFGGRLWVDDNDGREYYSSGRWEHDPRDLATGKPIAHNILNCKVWLGQWGISHWGMRVNVIGWEAHDCTRGANVFGVAQLTHALVVGQSDNKWARYPDRLWDLDPIAGFRWYDTRVMTILANVTFKNYVYQPQLGTMRQGVWFSMVHSDEYKPMHISTSVDIKYENIDWRGLVHHETVDTGASRYFNWIDWDGSASRRYRPTLFASWPRWWQVGGECAFTAEWNVYTCDYLPWRTPSGLDIRIPGYTAQVDTFSALPPTPENYAGYVAQFGSTPSDNRSMIITRNEGFTGVTGPGGWYVHFREGVPQTMRVFVTQIPQGTSIVLATRYPQGTTFSIQRTFAWYGQYNAPLRQASTLTEVLASNTGELFYFDGRRLFIKLTDPGDASVDAPFTVQGATVYGTRYYSLSYDITTSLSCPWVKGGRFCTMRDDPPNDVPPALPSNYNSWHEPLCADVPPPGTFSCAQHREWGQCGEAWMTTDVDVHVKPLGGYCAITCGRCTAGQRVCVDVPVPGGISGGLSCAELRDRGGCYAWYMGAGGFCGNTCGRCNGKGTPCVEVQPSDGTTCAQRVKWGSCGEAWLREGNMCRVACGVCKPETAAAPEPATPPCTDINPQGSTCDQQRGWGKCGESWMASGGFCAATCGRCTPCDDNTPPGGYSCAQQREWGKCGEAWINQGGYCRATCGVCSAFGIASFTSASLDESLTAPSGPFNATTAAQLPAIAQATTFLPPPTTPQTPLPTIPRNPATQLLFAGHSPTRMFGSAFTSTQLLTTQQGLPGVQAAEVLLLSMDSVLLGNTSVFGGPAGLVPSDQGLVGLVPPLFTPTSPSTGGAPTPKSLFRTQTTTNALFASASHGGGGEDGAQALLDAPLLPDPTLTAAPDAAAAAALGDTNATSPPASSPPEGAALGRKGGLLAGDGAALFGVAEAPFNDSSDGAAVGQNSTLTVVADGGVSSTTGGGEGSTAGKAINSVNDTAVLQAAREYLNTLRTSNITSGSAAAAWLNQSLARFGITSLQQATLLSNQAQTALSLSDPHLVLQRVGGNGDIDVRLRTAGEPEFGVAESQAQVVEISGTSAFNSTAIVFEAPPAPSPTPAPSTASAAPVTPVPASALLLNNTQRLTPTSVQGTQDLTDQGVNPANPIGSSAAAGATQHPVAPPPPSPAPPAASTPTTAGPTPQPRQQPLTPQQQRQKESVVAASGSTDAATASPGAAPAPPAAAGASSKEAAGGSPTVKGMQGPADDSETPTPAPSINTVESAPAPPPSPPSPPSPSTPAPSPPSLLIPVDAAFGGGYVPLNTTPATPEPITTTNATTAPATPAPPLSPAELQARHQAAANAVAAQQTAARAGVSITRGGEAVTNASLSPVAPTLTTPPTNLLVAEPASAEAQRAGAETATVTQGGGGAGGGWSNRDALAAATAAEAAVAAAAGRVLAMVVEPDVVNLAKNGTASAPTNISIAGANGTTVTSGSPPLPANTTLLPFCPPCTDAPPSPTLPCSEVVAWDMCAQSWSQQQGVCDASCNRCTLHDSCWDLLPPFGNCSDIQAAFRCTDPFVLRGGWCRRTCGLCLCPNPPALGCIPTTACRDTPPPAHMLPTPAAAEEGSAGGNATATAGGGGCAELVSAGLCDEGWVVDGGYCLDACGRCYIKQG